MTRMQTLMAATAFSLLTAAGTASAAPAAPALEPTTQHFLDALTAKGGPKIYQLTPDQARNVLAGAQSGDVAKQPANIVDRTIPGGPTGSVRLRIVRPQDSENAVLPAVMYFHGGGWILGDKNTHDRLVREIANGAGAAVVFVDYDRSPEAKFPVPIEQAYAATKYVAEHGDEFKIDPSRLAVAGDSVGGNMTAAVTLLAKERHGPKIVFQVLFYPVTDANFDDGSYKTFANGPWLTREAMKWFWNAYLPDKAKRRDPLASPLQASIEQLRGLPPALLITDENDVLRDEGEAYGRKLAAAGNVVTSVRYNGTIHDFAMLNAIAGTPATRGAIAQANAALKQALAK